MKILDILKLVAVGAEEFVPIFVHNPSSQKIEAIIFADVNAILASFSTSAPPAAQTKGA